MSLVVLDIEQRGDGPQPPSLETVHARCEFLDYAAYIHTTAGHRSEAPQYRVICDVSRNFSTDENRMLVASLAKERGLTRAVIHPRAHRRSVSTYHR